MAAKGTANIVGITFEFLGKQRKLPVSFAPLCRWTYQLSGFGKMGVYVDDVKIVTPEIEEALKRIPKEEMDGRNFRLTRAIHLSAHKEILPKSEWHTWDDDYKYLQKYIEQVREENIRKESWENIEQGDK